MSLELPLTSDTVPENLECIISNSNWLELVALLSVTLPDGSKINVGPGPIAPEDRIWPWLRLEADGKPDNIVGGQLYVYVGGVWLATHPQSPGIVSMYEGTEASITTFNGGEAGAVTSTSGPFWERVTQMNGRIPIGPGEITAGPPAVNIAENENKGEYDMQLGDENYRHHKHYVISADTQSGASPPTSSNQVAVIGGGFGNENYNLQGTGSAANVALSSNVNGDTAANEAFPILPQVRGIFFIRRTSRIYMRR